MLEMQTLKNSGDILKDQELYFSANVSQCSGDNPCSTCLKLALSLKEKVILKFSGCIRTLLKDVSVFKAGKLPGYNETI